MALAIVAFMGILPVTGWFRINGPFSSNPQFDRFLGRFFPSSYHFNVHFRNKGFWKKLSTAL